MFETKWVLTAPIDRVFEVLQKTEDFASWWPSVSSSRLLEEGDSDGVGARAAYSVRSPLRYKLDFEVTAIEVDEPRRIHSIVRGDLVGTGTYSLEEADGRTHITFNWFVATTKPWMNFVGGFAKPALAWAHHSVMREGCDAMAKHLDARLISVSTGLVKQPAPVPAAM